MSGAPKEPSLHERLLAVSLPVDVLECCLQTMRESSHARNCSWCGEALDRDGFDFDEEDEP